MLKGPAAEWCGSTIQDAMTWKEVRTLFITRFSDGRNKFRHRMEVEHCIRADGEEIRKFLHRMKKTVDKGWPDDMAGVVAAEQAAVRTAQARQRRQRYIAYTLKGLRPRYVQRKAQEYLMGHPNATWNNFSTHLVIKDVFYQVSTNFLKNEEQNKAQMASLGPELKNLRTELKDYRVNALEGNKRHVDPNQKGRQIATRFWGYCRTKGCTPNYCRNKIWDEEIKKLQNEATSEKKFTFNQDYKRYGPSHGSGNWTRQNDDNGAMMSTLRSFTRGNFRPSNQNPNNFRQNRPSKRRNYPNNNNNDKTNSPYHKIPPSQISADNPDQNRPHLQCSTDLEVETRATIYLTTRNSQPPTTVTSRTWFDSLQLTMKLMNHQDYALQTTEVSEFNCWPVQELNTQLQLLLLRQRRYSKKVT